MKKGIHPENYRPVVFKDMSNGDMFLSRSTAKALLTRSIPVRASSSTPLVASTSS